MAYTYVVAMYLLFAVLREWRLKTLWALPMYRGEDWFFDARIGADHPERPRLLRQYRAWMLGTAVVVEVLACADFFVFGSLSHLVWVQAPLTWGLAAARRLILRGFVLQARDLTSPPADGPCGLSLRPRRLGDYSSPRFEIANSICACGALAVIVMAGRPWLILPVELIVYYEIGALLWKLALLRRPVPLPAGGAEEYLHLAEDAFRHVMRSIDWARAACTSVLVIVAAKVTWWTAWAAHEDILVMAMIAGLVVMTFAMLFAQGRRGRTLLAKAKELQVPAWRRRLPDPENLHWGGLVYRNADNPAVVVDGGPLRFAVNVVNKATYLYVAYWIGLAFLMAKLVENL